MEKIKDRNRLKLFLDEYVRLCKKYNLVISACGCCDSPWVIEVVDGKIEDGVYCGKDIETSREWIEEGS